VEGCLARLEKLHPEMILLPPFYYGTSSYAVSGPENGYGTVSIDSMHVFRFAEDLFTNLLEIGFRNIHGFYYHQSENFMQGMPTDLAFRFAGRRAIFAFLERTSGRGWWGKNEMKNYYQDNNVFDWIRIHPVVGTEVDAEFGSDHAGRVETSAMMALYPDLVHMENLNNDHWYSETARDAGREFGESYIRASVESLEQLLFAEKK
jgi:creatinine amidohydrolase